MIIFMLVRSPQQHDDKSIDHHIQGAVASRDDTIFSTEHLVPLSLKYCSTNTVIPRFAFRSTYPSRFLSITPSYQRHDKVRGAHQQSPTMWTDSLIHLSIGIRRGHQIHMHICEVYYRRGSAYLSSTILSYSVYSVACRQACIRIIIVASIEERRCGLLNIGYIINQYAECDHTRSIVYCGMKYYIS